MTELPPEVKAFGVLVELQYRLKVELLFIQYMQGWDLESFGLERLKPETDLFGQTHLQIASGKLKCVNTQHPLLLLRVCNLVCIIVGACCRQGQTRQKRSYC